MKLYRPADKVIDAHYLLYRPAPDNLNPVNAVVEVEASPIPWCAEHNHPVVIDDICAMRAIIRLEVTLGIMPREALTSCRLEEPQAVYRIKGTT